FQRIRPPEIAPGALAFGATVFDGDKGGNALGRAAILREPRAIPVRLRHAIDRLRELLHQPIDIGIVAGNRPAAKRAGARRKAQALIATDDLAGNVRWMAQLLPQESLELTDGNTGRG